MRRGMPISETPETARYSQDGIFLGGITSDRTLVNRTSLSPDPTVRIDPNRVSKIGSLELATVGDGTAASKADDEN